MRQHVSWHRQPWRHGEVSTAHVPDRAGATGPDATGTGEVWALVRALPEQQRATVVLRYYEQLSIAETAAVLGCSTGTVKSNTQPRARRAAPASPTAPCWPDDPGGTHDRADARPTHARTHGSWLPADFVHPGLVEVPFGHHLRPIHPDDTDLDMVAVMGSRERLWRIYGAAWGWPPADMTHEDDRADLARHAAEMETHESFNYALFDTDETALLGCVYIDPPEVPGSDAEISWWVVDECVGTELEQALDELVPQWIAPGVAARACRGTPCATPADRSGCLPSPFSGHPQGPGAGSRHERRIHPPVLPAAPVPAPVPVGHVRSPARPAA